MAKSSKSEKSKAEQAEEQSGVPVPAGTQVSPSAGEGRTVQDMEGRPVPEDEQTKPLKPDSDR